MTGSGPKSLSQTARPYRSARWPQAERLQHDVGGNDMIGAMVSWRDFNAMPAMCAANDNFPEDSDATDPHAEKQEYRFDNLMTTQSAKLTVKLQAEGKTWRPAEERFDTPRRNNRNNAAPPVGSYRYNGVDLPALPDAESEATRAIDCTSARRRLGHVCCRLLDLASADARRAEIAGAVKQPDTPRVDVWTDWAIIRWMRDAAYAAYYGRATH